MSYIRSYYRNSFDAQVNFLVKKARRAQRLKASDSDIRDLVFQCAVFLTGAATETYIKLVIEAWVQKVKANDRGAHVPPAARAFIASKRLETKFAHFQYNRDEKALYSSIQAEDALWPLLSGDPKLPKFFEGKALHDGSAYPSQKNIKKLFSRVGLDNMIGRISENLSRDAEVLIESFQSVRTALAHSAPPTITVSDVETLLSDCKSLVGSIDRILYGHVIKHGGTDCWTV